MTTASATREPESPQTPWEIDRHDRLDGAMTPGKGPDGASWRLVADCIWTLVRTDFKVRYHGSLGGFAWALLKPFSMFLVLMGVFSYIFVTTADYRLNLIVGLFLWEFFAEGTKTGLLSLYGKAYLLKKSRFPRWIVIITSVTNAWITLLVFTAAVVIYLVVAGRPPSIGRLLLFMTYQIEMSLIILGFSLATSVLYLRYRDLNHLWEAAAQAGFFVVPIIYPLDILPPALQTYVYLWPPTPVIQYSRQVLIDGTVPSLFANMYLLGLVLLTLVSGVLVFRRHAPSAIEQL
jgi:ABC-type polysaccharide/polyol phosphate export permease